MQAYELDRPERLRAHLACTRQLYQPLADGQGTLRWQRLNADDERPFVVPAEPPVFSAKAFFFAEREALFATRTASSSRCRRRCARTVLFGLAACDLTAVAYQDRFFASDPHYQARRAATLLVGVDCAHSCRHGFCAMMDSGPEVRPHTADLILCPLQQRWLLLVASEPGEQALAGLALQPAPADWAQQRDAQALQVAVEQGEQTEIALGCAALNGETVDSQTWEALGLRCLGCSGCTSVCPTCSCFAPLQQPGAAGGVVQERCGIPACTRASRRRPAGTTPAPHRASACSASGTTSSATTSASASAATAASVADAAMRCAPAASACTR